MATLIDLRRADALWSDVSERERLLLLALCARVLPAGVACIDRVGPRELMLVALRQLGIDLSPLRARSDDYLRGRLDSAIAAAARGIAISHLGLPCL